MNLQNNVGVLLGIMVKVLTCKRKAMILEHTQDLPNGYTFHPNQPAYPHPV